MPSASKYADRLVSTIFFLISRLNAMLWISTSN